MKYLISLYFDDSTNFQINKHIEAVAKVSGNEYMLINRIPPHITVSSFETENEDMIKTALDAWIHTVKSHEIQWVGIGIFRSSVLYVTPVLNKWLQTLVEDVYNCIGSCDGVNVSRYYRPYQWLPHTTIGKKLSSDELNRSFAAVHPSFQRLQGRVTAIGLAKTSPYEDINVWNLKG